MLLEVIAILVFLAVVTALWFVFSAMETRNARARVLRERLATLDHAAQRGPSEELALLRDELLSDIPAVNKLLARSPKITQLQNLLSQADMKMRAGKFLLISVVAAVVTGLLAAYLAGWWIWGIMSGPLAGAAPFFYVSFMRSRRFQKFETMFPEAVDLLARAVRAGHAFTTAIELIATELGEPVAGEFRILFEEQKFGLPVRDAMMNLAERMPITDVKFFVTAVMLQRETGGNLAEILDNLSYVIRERFKIMRQVRVYTAQGRLTLIILTIMPPFFLLMSYLLRPDYIKPLFVEPEGHRLLVYGIVLQVIGFFVIRKIIQPKV